MPEDDTDTGPESDLPDPSSGETFSDLDSLKETLSGGQSGGETAERLRNAVYWTATFVTLSGTARDALRAAVQQLEEQFNDGEPFPDRDEELKGGNPNLKG